jgi:hypothetical protein
MSTTYPTQTAKLVAMQRPDLAANDAIAAVLTADPGISASEVIAVLDEATDDHADDVAAEHHEPTPDDARDANLDAHRDAITGACEPPIAYDGILALEGSIREYMGDQFDPDIFREVARELADSCADHGESDEVRP